jgi:hypothetical protein
MAAHKDDSPTKLENKENKNNEWNSVAGDPMAGGRVVSYASDHSPREAQSDEELGAKQQEWLLKKRLTPKWL